MSAKTERITILGTPEFKTFLTDQADAENISVSEFVRRRCVQPVARDEDIQTLAELVSALHVAVDAARDEMNESLDFAKDVLQELQSNRDEHRPASAASG